MNPNKNLVIIDSNFILLPFQFKIDYFSEIRLKIEGSLKFIIYQQILDELNSKKKRMQKNTNFIRFLDAGLMYVNKNKEKHDIEILEDTKKNLETTDDFLIRMSEELQNLGYNVYIATNDSELRKKAKKLYFGTIFLRQKKYLSIERA